jgi:hypothetical protein
MDDLKAKHEKWVGDEFISWLSVAESKQFNYVGRPDRAPDLVYRSEPEELQLEVASAYHDRLDARWRWENARGKPDAPHSWSGVNATAALLKNLSLILADKCSKSYGSNCMLILYIDPPATEAEMFEERLGEISMPSRIPFKRVYLMGDFGQSSRSAGGRRFWKLFDEREA